MAARAIPLRAGLPRCGVIEEHGLESVAQVRRQVREYGGNKFACRPVIVVHVPGTKAPLIGKQIVGCDSRKGLGAAEKPTDGEEVARLGVISGEVIGYRSEKIRGTARYRLQSVFHPAQKGGIDSVAIVPITV